MTKSIAEINEKIAKGRAVVVTAEEVTDLVKQKGVARAAKEVDVVTTGTFGPMCSSGAYFNLGHSQPRIKAGGGHVYLNDVPCYTGVAAVDVYLGATAIPDNDPRNMIHPGEFNYGGGHVIEELVAGKDVRLVITAYGTDCYPRKKVETWINLESLNEAVLFNMRNAYQNYNVAVNLGDRTIYTYMGVLKPNLGNANYSTSGQLSPLFNDPYYKTIGIGTRIFLGGGTGYVAWQGTQHNPSLPRNEKGIPTRPAGTLAVIGDIKQMSSRWLVGTSFDKEISAPVIDYFEGYPQRSPDVLGEVSYAELKSGKIKVRGKDVPTASLSSYSRAVDIANILKGWIEKGEFYLTDPVAPIPGAESGATCKPMQERPIEREADREELKRG
jgi:uncharacterized protein (DUF39 family)